MASGPIETFEDISSAWLQAARQSDRRAIWRSLARGGWFRACQHAVQQHDRPGLAAWLQTDDPDKQAIVHFQGTTTAQLVQLYVWCSLSAYWIQVFLDQFSADREKPGNSPYLYDTARELLQAVHNVIAPSSAPVSSLEALTQTVIHACRNTCGDQTERFNTTNLTDQVFTLLAQENDPAEPSLLSTGFSHDLCRELLGLPVRPAEQTLTLNALLVDTARNVGVGASLTLELLTASSPGLYPASNLVFVQDEEFRQATDNACAWTDSLWPTGSAVRWRLERRDGQPITSLSGPSLGATFALGLGKLFAAHSESASTV